MGIVWPGRWQRATLQVVLQLPGRRFRHGALLRITPKQFDHTDCAHGEVQARRWGFFGKNLLWIPASIGAAERADTLSSRFGINGGIGPVDEDNPMLVGMDQDMGGQNSAMDHLTAMRKSERHQQTPPDPGHIFGIDRKSVV